MEHLAALGVLLAASWPASRAVASRAFWHTFPHDAARIAAATAGGFAFVAAVAIFAPGGLIALASIAAIASAWLLWRIRPQYGVGDGLPPGSLDPFPVRPWSDPDFFARQAARHGSVFKMSQFARPLVCVVGLERANRLLLAHDEQLFPPPLPFSRFIEGGYLRYLPEEIHLDYRRFFSALFDPEVVARAEPTLAARFRAGLADMARRCAAHPDARGEAAAPVVHRTMFSAWTQLFYGIAADHPDFAALQACCIVIDTRRARWARRRPVETALAEIEAILRRRMEAFPPAECAAPQSFLASLAARQPEALGDGKILGNLIYIMLVSWGDVSGLLLWVWKKLDDHPAWRERLAAELRATDAHAPQRAADLATRIVQETLRLEQSEHRYRRANADLEIDGFRIPAGWSIRICVRESHQDPAIFPEPKRFDPDRFRDRTFTRAEYAPFGVFRLACIGEALTKTTARLFASELVAHFETHTTRDGPPRFSSFSHNAPSPRWRVHLEEKTASA